VTIGHDLIHKIVGTSDLASSGKISGDTIKSITIGGSIISEVDNTGGSSRISNIVLQSTNDIGSITVKGDITGDASSPVIIMARGQKTPGATSDVAIGNVNVSGRVDETQILVGYNALMQPVNADAQIGSVNVGGDWIASSLVAGAKNSQIVSNGQGGFIRLNNVNFGDASDAKISGTGTMDNPNLISKIASIVIKGQILGTADSVSTTDHFGFVAEQIGFLQIGNYPRVLHPGSGNDHFALGPTGDVAVDEIP
jgi:hypothetical protein